MSRARVKLVAKPVMSAHRRSLKQKYLVYVLAVNKPLTCNKGRSRIVYIGTTEKGVERISASVAQRAEMALRKYGVKRIAAFVLTCPPLKRTKIWLKLERAALLAFKDQHQQVPWLNVQGKNYKNRDVFDLIAYNSILKQLEKIENIEI
ncbi:MAG: hypothetical protein IT331_19195 [Anaerolineae bacterium]|nr:hypothetical protein [Anaerolineae bacterium]